MTKRRNAMTHDRPRSLTARLRSLIHGIFAVWVKDSERQNPRAVYEEAINQRTRQYRDLKEAVAGILYMRNKLDAEIVERRAEIARLHDDIRRAVRTGQDDLSVALIARKQRLLEDLERAENELEGVRCEAEESKANLVRFREEIRGLVQEKSRMLATLASAQARRRMSEAIEGLSVDADMKALEGVRDHIARISTEGALDREIGDATVRTRIRAIRDEVRDEAARRELHELKAQMFPELAEKATSRERDAMSGSLAAAAT
jgi:phage shock protein A